MVLQPPWGLHGAPVDWGREETGHTAVQVVTSAAAHQISGRRRFSGPRARYQRLRHRLVFCGRGPSPLIRRRGAGRFEQIVVAVRQPVGGRRRDYSTAATTAGRWLWQAAEMICRRLANYRKRRTAATAAAAAAFMTGMMMLSGRRAVVVVVKGSCCGAGAGFLVNAVGPL